MSEHTKGLLALFRDGQSVGAADGTGVCEVWPRDAEGFPDAEGKANSRRIVACWNFCDGNNTEGMETAIKIGETFSVMRDRWIAKELELTAQLADATRQCGAMAELLRDIHEYIGASIPQTISEHYQGCDLLDRIDAVLAGKLPDAWLPIETAPRDGRKALVYRPLAENSGDERIAVKRLTGGQSNNCWDKTVPPGATPCNPTDGACHVTHWMPLPDEPAQQGGEPCAIASPLSSPD